MLSRRTFVLSTTALAFAGCVPTNGDESPSASNSESTSLGSVPAATDPVVATGDGYLRVRFLSERVVQLWMRADSEFGEEFSYAVPETPAAAAMVREEVGSSTRFSLGGLSVVVDRGGGFSAFVGAGVPVLADARVALGGDRRLSWRLEAAETLHGLGSRASGLDLRGRRYGLWNTDARSYYPGDDPLYLSIPFLLGVRDDLSYGVLWDNPSRGQVDVGNWTDRVEFRGEAGELRCYLVVGSTPADVVREYTTLTGAAYLPPLWAMGYHQSRWSYTSAAEFLALAKRFRAESIPCDALYFDIDYMHGFRCLTWDHSAFPDMPGLQKSLHDDGFHTVTILDPGVKVDPAYDLYREGRRGKHFLRDSFDAELHRPVWPGDCAFPDFTDPHTRAWWSGRVADFVDEVGFDGIWNDMNEPSVMVPRHGVTLPDETVHACDGHRATSAEAGHNVYGLTMAQASYQGLVAGRGKERPFNITRAGHAGIARNATNWTGDTRSSWEHLRLSITMALNLGVSGVPFTGPDIGGFRGDPDAELMTRWMQVASMLPFFRNHAAKTAPAREPWQFGAAATKNLRAAIELRYRMLGYLYSEYALGIEAGLPLVRPLFFDDPSDRELRAVQDAFLVGSQLLAAPVVVRGARRRTLRLPKGEWYTLDGAARAGGKELEVLAPLNHLPLFVRAGAAIMKWPVRQHVGEPLRSVELHIYWGDGETTLYEDAGDGYGYQKDEWRRSVLTVATGARTVSRRVTGSFDPGYSNLSVTLHMAGDQPQQILVDGAPVEFTTADGSVSFQGGAFQEITIR